MNWDIKKAFSKRRRFGISICGVILDNALSFCPPFWHISLIWALKFSFWSIFTPSSFSHLLFLIVLLSMKMLDSLHCNELKDGIYLDQLLFDLLKTTTLILWMDFLELQLLAQYFLQWHMVYYHQHSLQNLYYSQLRLKLK